LSIDEKEEEEKRGKTYTFFKFYFLNKKTSNHLNFETLSFLSHKIAKHQFVFYICSEGFPTRICRRIISVDGL